MKASERMDKMSAKAKQEREGELCSVVAFLKASSCNRPNQALSLVSSWLCHEGGDRDIA